MLPFTSAFNNRWRRKNGPVYYNCRRQIVQISIRIIIAASISSIKSDLWSERTWIKYYCYFFSLANMKIIMSLNCKFEQQCIYLDSKCKYLYVVQRNESTALIMNDSNCFWRSIVHFSLFDEYWISLYKLWSPALSTQLYSINNSEKQYVCWR